MVHNTDEKPKRLNIWLPLFFSIVLIGGMMIGMKLKNAPLIQTRVQTTEDISFNNTVETGKVEELIRYIEARYVDDVDRDILIEKAIKKVLDELDPHSNYIGAAQLKEVNQQLEGNFEGVGIEFMMLDDTILVVSPISGGPSETAGILAGDKIIAIEDTIVAGKEMAVSDIVSRLRGESGTDVNVGIKRGQETELRTFAITRDEIPINSVDVSYMLDDKTGYIKINRFSATTYKEFMEAMEVMIDKEGMKDLVIDVRQNPGGYLQEATNILSQLFEERSQLLVYTEGRTVKRNDYESTGRPFFQVGKLAVLIDEGSASASEILAGAIQDWDRGVVVGRRSFGKGLVQEQYNLQDGSALRLTVARYYTPSGRSIQKSYDDKTAYDRDVSERLKSGELYDVDSIAVIDSTQFYTKKDNRIVYGGGGITPDIFVPLDTSFMDSYYLQLRNHVPQFIYRYLEKNGSTYNDYALEDFRNKFTVSDQMLKEFQNYADEKGVVKEPLKTWKEKEALRLLLKARIARQYFGEKGNFFILNEEDPVVKKAINALKFKNPLSAFKGEPVEE